MNNLVTRTITGIVLALLTVSAIILDHHALFVLFLIFTALGLWELFDLVELSKIYPYKIVGVLAGVLVFMINASYGLGYFESRILLLNIVPIFLIFLTELYRKAHSPFTNVAFSIFGVVYISVPFSLLGFFPNMKLQTGAYHPEILICFFAMSWLNDTVAYLVGSKVGRIKLIKDISPNKTWEGAIAGAVFTLMAAYGLSFYFTALSTVNWVVMAFLVVFFGNYGDLFESKFKRSLQIKESGSLFPGHGGILDRFDGILIAAPFVYVYLIFAL